jgi:3-oxoacyl-[acyl-carrier protein] reductase
MRNRARVAVVTGGSSGIGLATVSVLLNAGFKVAFFGKNADRVEQAVARLGNQISQDRLFARRVDIAATHEVAAFFSEVEGHWSAPDTLICNAGISPKGPLGATPFDEVGLDEWNHVLSTNLTGTMLCCQAVMSEMIRQRFGRIVLIGSIAGRTVPRMAGTAYVASKAALSGLSRSVLSACAGSGVTVNIIAPGQIVTEMTGDADNDANRAALSRIPVGRLGEPSDIASVVRFLASPEAGFINGAIIDVNGGEFTPL